MKILIVYHSQTGNTEIIAKVMNDTLKIDNQVTLLRASDVKPEVLQDYDIVFLGSSVYGGLVGKSLRQLMKRVFYLPEKFVLFSTHSSNDYVTHVKAFRKIRKSIEESNSKIIDEFDCLGENKAITPERQEIFMKNLDPDERRKAKEYLKLLKGHPNEEDIENARKFVINLIN
ncbi:MAG: flavodoxin family protein [Candidatus Helarchaeota archaeon]